MSLRARAALLALITLTACPGSRSNDGAPHPTLDGAVRGGVLRLLLTEDADSLDPQRAGSPPSWGLMRAMHRGLMAFPAAVGHDGTVPVPDLADGAPEVSADGLRYTFHLREGIAFGAPASRPLRAGDVRAGLERLLGSGAPVAAAFRVITGISAPDDRTVTITLARPANDLEWLLALPQASAVPAGLGPDAPPQSISPSGPYRLATRDGYRPERGIHLVRNEAWRASSDPVRHAWVDEISMTIGLSSAEVDRRILAGDADLSGDAPPASAAPVAPSAGPSGQEASGPRVVTASNGCLRYLFMNTRLAPFSSPAVRAAVAAALNRQAIVASEPAAVPAAVVLPPTVDGHDDTRPAPAADPAAARRALAAAGFPRGFDVSLFVGNTSRDRAEASAVRAALAAAGVRVTVRAVPIASVYEDFYELPAARVPMGIATWCADWPGLGGRGMLTPLVDGHRSRDARTTNYSGIASPSLDRLLDAAAAEPSVERAAERWLAADAAAVRLAAVVPLVHLEDASLVGARVRSFIPHAFFVRGDLTALWLAPGQAPSST